MYFPSKKDTLYTATIWGTIAIVFYAMISDFSITLSSLIGGIIGLLSIGFFVWAWFGTGYLIEDDTIHVQSGPLKGTIKIEEINKISKRKSVWASPALSMDRLVILRGRYDEVFVSPKKEEAFINLLLKKNPDIRLDEQLIEYDNRTKPV